MMMHGAGWYICNAMVASSTPNLRLAVWQL